jgi:hypothetical protein
MHHVDPTADVGATVMGQAVATAIGPAAGPHTQLAQNIVAGWLAGARIFELKTVQVRDDLDIPRPCIDVAGVGYNVEWSQELRIEQSLDEYVKAWMALAILGEWGPLRPVLGAPGAHIFDMSVGYDLAGIRTRAMGEFIAGLLDASPIIERLRPQIPEPFAAARERAFPSRIVSGVTLSTFHGCPPDEIEAIARHLMTEYGLDVVVKLNPTLLGIDAVSGVLQRLGHDEVVLDPDAFAADLQYERALEMIRSLRGFASGLGRTVGIKLTNTLVVRNHLGRLPGDTMYLSGPPLHVIAVTLLDRLDGDLEGMLGVGPEPGPVPVSFSAGIDRGNVTNAVGLGMAPVTMCTALLKPGGYGTLSGMLNVLSREMHGQDAPVADLVRSRDDAARRDGFRDAVAAYAAALSGDNGVRSFGKSATTPKLRRSTATSRPGLRVVQSLRDGVPQRRHALSPHPRAWASKRSGSTSASRSGATTAATARSARDRRPVAGQTAAVPGPGSLRGGWRSGLPGHCARWCACCGGAIAGRSRRPRVAGGIPRGRRRAPGAGRGLGLARIVGCRFIRYPIGGRGGYQQSPSASRAAEIRRRG